MLSPLAWLDMDWWEELVMESLEGLATELVSATVLDMALLEESAMELELATVLLEELATELLEELPSVLEECTTGTPDTMAPHSSTLLLLVRNASSC